MRRMTPEEQAAVQDWEVRQGAFNDPIHFEVTPRELLAYAIGFVAMIIASSFYPWGFA